MNRAILLTKPQAAINIKYKYRSLSKLQVYYVKVLYIVRWTQQCHMYSNRIYNRVTW